MLPEAVAASKLQDIGDGLERDRKGKQRFSLSPFLFSPTGPPPPDQSFIISLLLLVDPEVTDIERRAMETSL